MSNFLCRVKPTASFPTIPQIKGSATPKHDCDASELRASLEAARDPLIKLLLNKVKKCGKCSKPNGFTLANCNGCGESLAATEVSFTTNVFTGFVIGLKKGPFPFTISLRHQDENCMVIDDLLGLAPLHFNVIPSKHYIPDWRFLLRQPAQGLALITSLRQQCVSCAHQQFFSNEAWCKKLLKPGKWLDDNDFCVGFNYPPSQYQLHIQFMAPCFLPFQYHCYEKGIHFTPGRFFPFAYVEQVLKAAIDAPLAGEMLEETTPVEVIVAHFKTKHQIDYEAVHGAFYANFKVVAAKYMNWDPADFDGEARDVSGALKFFPQGADACDESVDVSDVTGKDKMALQNYGREYVEGKPTGSYYGFTKELKDLQCW